MLIKVFDRKCVTYRYGPETQKLFRMVRRAFNILSISKRLFWLICPPAGGWSWHLSSGFIRWRLSRLHRAITLCLSW